MNCRSQIGWSKHMLIGGHIKEWDDVLFLKENRFAFGELVFSKPEDLDYWPQRTLEIADPEFFLVGHGPKEGPPNDIENLRTNYLPLLTRTIEAAGQMQMRLLTFHLWLDARFIKEEVLKEKLNLISDICRIADDLNITICLENLSERASDLSRAVNNNSTLGITLDIGHAQLLSEQNTSFEIIESLQPFIKHVHLHDNYGGAKARDDLHLPPGKGIIDIPGIMRQLMMCNYSGAITLELENHELRKAREWLISVIHSINENSCPSED